MALLEAVETGQERVSDLRGELGRVRDALDRTDAVLAVADDSLCWPYGLSAAGDLLAVADSGNNRVTFWRLT